MPIRFTPTSITQAPGAAVYSGFTQPPARQRLQQASCSAANLKSLSPLSLAGYCNCGIGCIVFLGKQPGNGFANNIGTPDDNYFRPIKIDSGSAQNLLYPGGRAHGTKTILSAACQAVCQDSGMKSIHILVRVNCIHNCLFINAFRQGKLDERMPCTSSSSLYFSIRACCNSASVVSSGRLIWTS